MPIPLEHGRSQKIAKQKRKLERQEAGTTKDIRNLLYKARIHAIEADNGNDDAREDMWALLDAAIERGMSKGAISKGGGMVGKINALLDRPESQSHALGLLLNAADLLADLDARKAAEVRAIADKLDNTQDHANWQVIATPVREVYVR
tara:strand:+ start:18863 stop:19306 length:444 start_codon:yes stop_codon:yes gene_type:complete